MHFFGSFASVSVFLALFAQRAHGCSRYDESLGQGDKWHQEGYIKYEQPVPLQSSYHTTSTIKGQAVQFSTFMNGDNVNSEALTIKSNAVEQGQKQHWAQFKYIFQWSDKGIHYMESVWLNSDDSCIMSGPPTANDVGLPFQYSQLDRVTIYRRL